MEITSARLVLRPVAPGDAAALNVLINDWGIASMLGAVPLPQTVESTHHFVAAAEADRIAGTALHCAILAEDGPIGVVGLVRRRRGPLLGYWLGRPYWGLGYMTEAAGALIDHWFRCRDDAAIVSGVFAGNTASLRVQAKLGFEVAGERPHWSDAQGRHLPHIDTHLTRERRALILSGSAG